MYEDTKKLRKNLLTDQIYISISMNISYRINHAGQDDADVYICSLHKKGFLINFFLSYQNLK